MTEQQYNIKMRLPIDTVVIHHSDTPRDRDWKQTLNSIDLSHKGRLHKSRNGLGYHIAYHYIIFGGGKIVATRPLNEVGYHASDWPTNRKSIAICFIGMFMDEEPNPQQLSAAKQLLNQIRLKYKITKVAGHRAFAKTLCPGKNMTDAMIKKF